MLPLRLLVGFGFVAHGAAKWSRGPGNFGKLLDQIGAPLPTVTAWLVTIVSMLVAMFTVQLRYGFSSVNAIGLTPSGPVFGPPGYEINLLYIAALMTVVLAGPGACSVDEWLTRRGASVMSPSPRAAPRRVPPDRP